MSLSRSSPLRTDRSHDWEEASVFQSYDYECSRCGERIVWPKHRDPPDWNNCPGLKRTGSLDRNSRLSPVSDTNSGGPETFGPLADYARRLGCTVDHHPDHTCTGDVQAHHVRSRGAGHGDRLADGSGNVVGLCHGAHLEIHRQGRETFERSYEINLAARAATIGERYETVHSSEAGVSPGSGGDHVL